MEQASGTNTKKDAGFLDNLKEGNGDYGGNTGNQPVLFGGHEIRAIGNLKYLQKAPTEDYFGGTKKKKQKTQRKINNKTDINCLTNFVCGVPRNGANDIRMPTVSPATSKKEEESQREENAVARQQLELKFYKYQKLRECNERKNQTEQRRAEENYLEELENMAETWVEYNKRRNQLSQTQDFYFRRPPRQTRTYSKIGCSIISRKYWSDDKTDDPSKTREKEKEVGKDTGEQLDCDKLGEELQEKLVFVYEDDSDES